MSNEINNLNYVTGTRAIVVIPDALNTSLTAVRWNVPGISLPAARFPTPFADKPVHGDKLEPEQLRLDFIVTENLENWLEVYNWLIALGAPEQKDIQYKEPKAYTDVVVTVFSSHNNPIQRFRYIDCVPTYLGGIDYDTQEGDTTFKHANLVLEYERMVVEPI